MLRRALLWMTIGSLVAAAMIGVAAILLPQSVVTERVLVTVALFGAFSLVALLCVYARERHTHPVARTTLDGGATLAGLAFTIWMVAVWDILPVFLSAEGEPIVKAGFICTTVSLSIMHVGMVTMIRARQPTRSVQIVASACSALIATGLVLATLTEQMDEWLARVLAALGIVATTTTLISFIALKAVPAQRLRREPRSVRPRFPMVVRCPRCGGTHELPLGEAHCPVCDLRIETAIDEPLCDCGYALLGLSAGVCPECGEAVAPDRRWALGPEARAEAPSAS